MIANKKDLISFIEELLFSIGDYNVNDNITVEDFIENLLNSNDIKTTKEVIESSFSEFPTTINILLLNINEKVVIKYRDIYKTINFKRTLIGKEYHINFQGFTAEGVVPNA